MIKYKNYFVYIFAILIFFNLFLLPTFYKKITRCYITLEINYAPDKENITSQLITKITSKYPNISALHSGSFKTINLEDQVSSIYRIIGKEEQECINIYSKINIDLINYLPKVNIIILDDVKSKARIVTFYLINNIILLIFLTGIYFLFTEKISFRLRIKKN